MLNLILFGAPGAGKGTQAEYLIKNFGLIHLSTGDILRREVASQSELGIDAKKFIDKGELVPDGLVIDMIKEELQNNHQSNGFIFDGFPRTVAQAEALDQLLEEQKTPVNGMICLEVNKEELIARLLNRGKTSGRSDDQNRKIIENRIAVYNKKTTPLKDYYEAQNKHYDVNGMGTIDEIADRLKQTVQGL